MLGPSSSSRLRVSGLLALAAALLSCTEQPLESRSRVTYPRVLAIVAEPPEARPGQLVALRAFVGGASERTTYRWLICTRPEASTTFTASSSFGLAEPDNGCFGDAAVGVFEIGRGREAFFSVPADWLQQLERLRAVYGGGLSPAALQLLARTVGLVVTIALEISDPSSDAGVGVPSQPFRAIKRVVVVDRPDTNTNPPPPAFDIRLGDPSAAISDPSMDGGTARVIHMARSVTDPDRCVPIGSPGAPERLRLRRGERIVLAPESDPRLIDRWLEPYTGYDAAGRTVQLRETAFYSFYSTAGGFAGDRTRASVDAFGDGGPPPDGGTIFTANSRFSAPSTPGPLTLWIFVRDGRGGTSGCAFDAEVMDAMDAR